MTRFNLETLEELNSCKIKNLDLLTLRYDSYSGSEVGIDCDELYKILSVKYLETKNIYFLLGFGYTKSSNYSYWDTFDFLLDGLGDSLEKCIEEE